jgi:hypothetical protein
LFSLRYECGLPRSIEFSERPPAAPCPVLCYLAAALRSGASTRSSTAEGDSIGIFDAGPVPRPDFINRRPLIPDFLLKDKREGRFITAVPAIGWDQQAGFNLGVVGFLFDNGKKDDPFFRTTPYRQQISVTALGALSGLQRCGVKLDQPNMFDGPYRLRADVQYAIDPLNNHFGIGRPSRARWVRHHAWLR